MQYLAAHLSRVSADLSTYVRTLLEIELTRSGRFRLAERARVAVVLEELSFQQSGVTDQSNAVAIGQHLNVHKIFYAQTHRVSGKLALTVQIVDVETNQVQRTISENLGTTQQQIAAGAQ